MIVRDGAQTLPGLLRSISGAFDQIVLVDTGSEDRTCEIFDAWAKGQDLPLGYRVENFDWADDFAAARNYADSLLMTDWLCYADADDVIVGADRLRQIAATAPGDLAVIAFSYAYYGSCSTFRIGRERLARRGAARWHGRTHETWVTDGGRANVPPAVCEWVHRRTDFEESYERDQAIARRWVEDEPDSPRALAAAATASFQVDDPDRAVRYLRRYLSLGRVRRELGTAFDAAEEAFDRLTDALRESPDDWPTHISLLERAFGRPVTSWTTP